MVKNTLDWYFAERLWPFPIEHSDKTNFSMGMLSCAELRRRTNNYVKITFSECIGKQTNQTNKLSSNAH